MYWDIALGSEHDSKSRWDMPRLPQRAKCSIFWTQLESTSAVYIYFKYRCLISRSPNLDLPPYRFELERWSHDHSLSARRQGRKGRNSQTQSLRNKAKKWNYLVQSHPSLVTIKSSRRKLVESRRLLRFLFRKVVTWSGQSHWQTKVYSTKRKEKEKELREEAVTTKK